MDTDVQKLGEVGMDEVIQSETEIVTDDPAGDTAGDAAGDAASGEAPAEESTGETSSVDAEVTFYNAKDVPQELRSTFHEMKKAFTQKTQVLADKVRQADSAQHHANLFRRIMGDDRVVAFLDEIDRTGGGVGGQAPAQILGGDGSEDADMDPRVAELQRQVQKLTGDINRTRQRQDLDAEKTAFVTAHPDWKQYEGGMDEAWKRVPNRSYEDAFNWAFRQSFIAKKAQIQRQRGRAQASVEKPGPASGTQRSVKINSFQDAVRAALDEHGMSRDTFKV